MVDTSSLPLTRTHTHLHPHTTHMHIHTHPHTHNSGNEMTLLVLPKENDDLQFVSILLEPDTHPHGT